MPSYLRGDFVYGRTFLHDADLDQQRQVWLDRVANVRVHGTTRERPRDRLTARSASCCSRAVAAA
jgi:transposase